MEEAEVYTFNFQLGQCQVVKWKGCETQNKFDDKDLCTDICRKYIKNEEIDPKEETASTEDKTDDKTGSGDDKKSSEKDGTDQDGTDKKSEEEKKEEEEEAKDAEDPEKLKHEDSTEEGDPEETSSVRRSRGNQTLSQSLSTTTV